ncbi:F-box domain-containing protein [Mycena kentingensis (nom. inval.)]|nr:F-box domain-containing protein [Mycena kentingensis (nom. inval.)]
MQSPIQNLLHTNAVPSPGETACIRDFLSATAEPELIRLEAEVARLQELLALATTKRDEHRAFTAAHRAVISPTRFVPDDILRVIFVETLPQNRDTALCADEGPLLLAQICKRWLAVALTTPRLWASMYLSIPPSSGGGWNLEPGRPSLLWIVSVWLERSGAVPLSFTINAARRQGTSAVVDTALQELLVSCAPRWKTLRFAHDLSIWDFPRMASLTADNVPQLKELFLSQSPNTGSSYPVCELTAAPNLRRLAYRGRFSELHLDTPWLNLRSLYMRAQDRHGTDPMLMLPLDILEHCQLLEELTLVIGKHPDVFALPEMPDHITLPQLSVLSMQGLSAPNWPQFFSRVHCPSLTALAVQDAWSASWLMGANFQLTSLKLADTSVKTETLVRILGHMPNLAELSLATEPLMRSPFHDPELQFLQPLTSDYDFLYRLIPDSAATSSTPLLAARLQRISLRGLITISEQSVVAFVQSRSPARVSTNSDISPLTHAEFFFHRAPGNGVDILAELGDLSALGIRVRVDYRETWRPTTYSARDGIFGDHAATAENEFVLTQVPI